MDIRRAKDLLLFAVFLLSVAPVIGQKSLTGRVVDVTGNPLPYAMVIAFDTLVKQTLTYTSTGEKGGFNLSVGDKMPIVLVTRYLGKAPDSLMLSPPWSEFITIRLKDGAALPEIEVTSARSPITEKGDTTSYNIADFRDSTDNKIEDILRKLPGVEVNENGSIEVNGKAIQTILIEGSDIFGMDYQLASKNIRASDIGTIETIDHYQEDVVMRTVNFSEEIVLNLKLRPEKRSIISGEVLGAAGAGISGARYQLYAPLYRISRRNKTFAIVNSDNIAANNGLGQNINMLANGMDAIRAPLFGSKYFYDRPNISTQELPQAFTDNTRTLGGQLRYERSQGDHTVFVRFDGLHQVASQNSRQREIFVGITERYVLDNDQTWTNQLGSFNGGIEYRYLAPSKQTSLRTYGKLGRSVTDTDQRFAGENTLDDTTTVNNHPLLLRLIATHQLSEHMVGRLEVTYQSELQRTASAFTQSDLNILFREARDVELQQGLEARQSQSLLTARWLSRFSSRLKVDLSVAVGQERLAFVNMVNDITFTDTLLLNDLTPALKMIYAPGKWLHRMRGEYSFNQRGLNRYQATWSATTKLGDNRKIEFNVSQTAALTDPFALLSDVVYIASPFTATRSIAVNALNQRTALGGTMRWENNTKLARTAISISADRTVNELISDFNFIGTAIVSEPLLAPAQHGGRISLDRSFLSLALKSDVRLSAGIDYHAGIYQTEGALVEFSKLTYTTSMRTSWRVSGFLRLKGGLSLRYADGLTGLDLGLFTSRVNTEFIASFSRLRLYIAGFAVSNLSSEGHSTLWSTHLGSYYTLPVKNKRSLSIFFKIYNPLNRPTLERRYISGFFERNSIVATTGGFGYIGCSFGL